MGRDSPGREDIHLCHYPDRVEEPENPMSEVDRILVLNRSYDCLSRSLPRIRASLLRSQCPLILVLSAHA